MTRPPTLTDLFTLFSEAASPSLDKVHRMVGLRRRRRVMSVDGPPLARSQALPAKARGGSVLVEPVELWRSMLLDLPLDRRSFNDRFTPLRHDQVVMALERWCLAFGERDQQLRHNHAAEFGFLSLLLVTLRALDESEERRSAVTALSEGGATTATTHDCAGVCSVLVAQPAVQKAIQLVYAPPSDGPVTTATNGAGAASHWTADVEHAIAGGVDRMAAWQDLAFSSARFHRHGTTSIIVKVDRARGQAPAALKLILYPFLRIPSIKRSTLDYATNYNLSADAHDGATNGNSGHLAAVYASWESWISMEFIPGRTLAEFLATIVKPPAEVRPATPGGFDLRRCRELSVALIDALAELEARGQKLNVAAAHADLSPSNIIINQVGDDRYRMTLVDLGPNYLYTRSISGLEGADSAFIAPEVKSGTLTLDRADLYSLGQLVITFAGVVPNLDGTVPDLFYLRAPLVARLLEDLVDRDPAKRLLTFSLVSDPSPGGRSPVVYPYLRTTFCDELDTTIDVEHENGRSADRLIPLLRELATPFSGAPERQRKLWRAVKERKTHQNPGQRRYLRWLFIWSRIAAILFSTTAAVVLWWTFRDFGWDWGDKPLEILQKLTHSGGNKFPFLDDLRVGGYTIPDPRKNWLARAIGISYVLVGAKLYENIFAGLMPFAVGRGSGRLSRRAFAAELAMRSVPIVNSILVLSITLIEARFWPLSSAIGQTYAFVVNYTTVTFARTAFAAARDEGLSTVPAEDSRVTGLDTFAQWTPSAFFYAALVWIVGILIYAHILHDNWLYAGTVSSINVGLFYLIKCGLTGPIIRVALGRASLAGERVGKLHQLQAADRPHATGKTLQGNAVAGPRSATAASRRWRRVA